MEFKVGDRVEVLEPADGVGITQENNTGLGSVVRVDKHGCQLEIKVDDNDRAWWYGLDKVRRAMTVPKPTPSITVGTQVRLTGVVINSTNEQCWVSVFGADVGQEGLLIFYDPFDNLEVIRQPFKRGEVVWSVNSQIDEAFVVVNDEQQGMVDVTCCRNGHFTACDSASIYERRP